MARRGVATAFADIRADLTRFDADLAEARVRLIARMRELDQLAVVHVRADTAAVDTELSAAAAEAERLAAVAPTIHVSTDAALAAAQLAETEADAEALGKSLPVVNVVAETEAANAALAETEAAAKRVGATNPVVRVRTSGTAEAQSELAKTRDRVGELIGAETIGKLAAGATKITAIVGATGLVISGFALRATGQMERIQVAFKGILGPVAGPSFLKELKQFAAVTPFQLTQVTDAAQQLLAAFGPKAKDQILPTLTAIGDIVSVTGGSALQIDRVTLALTQMRGKGKVATQELNQLREALPGFNAIEPIAKALGVTVPEAMKAVEARTVDANVAIDAILKGMREYPGAAGAMDRQSQTLIGRLSTLKDVARFAAIDGFGSLNTAAKKTLESVISSFTSGALNAPFKTLSDALGNLLSTLVPGVIKSIGPLSSGFAAIINPLADALKVILPTAVQVIPVLGELIGTLIKALPLDLVQTIFDGLATGIATLNSVLQSLGTGGTGALLTFTAAAVALTTGGPLTAVIAGVTALGVAMEIFNGGQREIQRNVDNVAAALARQSDVLLSNKKSLDQLATSTKQVIDNLIQSSTLEGLGKGADGLEKVFGRLGFSMGALVPIITAVRQKGALKVGDLVDPLAVGSFDQLRTKMGLTVDQFDHLLKLVENGAAFSSFGNALDGNISALNDLERTSGLTRQQIEDLIGAVKAGGPAVLGQVNDLRTLTDALNRLPTEKAIKEFLEQKAAVLDGGQAYLTAALQGRTLEAATSDMATAQATLTAFLKLAGDTAIRSGADYIDLTDKQNNWRQETDKDRDSAEKAAAALETLSAPTQFLAEVAKQTSEQLDKMAASLDLSAAQVDFAKSLGVVEADTAVKSLSTIADRAAAAIDRVKAALDKLSGKKLDLLEAQTAMEHLLQTAKDFDGTSLDIQTGPGLKNVDSLIARIKAARDIATAVFDASNDPAKAAEAYAHEIARVGTQFVNSGGDLDKLNKKLSDLNALPIQFKAQIDQASVDGAKETLVTEVAKISASLPAVAAQISAQIDKGALGVAAAALDALKTAPDKGPRVAEILATVVDEETAKKALDELAKLPPTALHGFDLATADGIKNTEDLTAKLKAAQTQALRVFGRNGDAQAATQDYATSIGQIGQEFVNAGGNLDDLNAQVSALGQTPIEFQVGLDEKSKGALLFEIEKIRELHPRIAALITALADAGSIDVAKAALEAIRVNPNNENRVAQILAELDPTSAESTKAALDAIKDLPRVASVGVEVSQADLTKVQGDLDLLAGQVVPVSVVPGVSQADLDKVMGDLALLAGGEVTVPVKPRATSGGGGSAGLRFMEAGGFVQSFRQGGRPLGRHIRQVPPHFVTGAKPQFMYGEPSTHGEFFLSMAPQWRDRNRRLHEQAGRMLNPDRNAQLREHAGHLLSGPEYTVNAHALDAAIDKLSRVVHALTPVGDRRARAEHGQRILNMAAGAVQIVSPKPTLAGRALIDAVTEMGM